MNEWIKGVEWSPINWKAFFAWRKPDRKVVHVMWYIFMIFMEMNYCVDFGVGMAYQTTSDIVVNGILMIAAAVGIAGAASLDISRAIKTSPAQASVGLKLAVLNEYMKNLNDIMDQQMKDADYFRAKPYAPLTQLPENFLNVKVEL